MSQAANSDPGPIPNPRPSSRNRIVYSLLVVGTVLAGLASRSSLFCLPGAFGKYPGDCLWAIMIFWGIGVICPSLTTSRAAGLAVLVCAGVETAKLLPWDWLTSMRETTLGRLTLGRGFTWQNYIAYSSGIALAVLGEMVMANRRPVSAE